MDDATLDAWAASDNPVRRAHAANLKALRAGETPTRTMPTLLARAGYLASALVSAVASGGKTVPPKEQARRLTICRSCDRFADEKCTVCTCHMPWKTRLEAWHCPLPEPKW